MRRSHVLAALCFFFAFAAAGAPSVGTEAERRVEDEVTLVVHTAADCPICKAWRESNEGLPVAQRLPKEAPPIKVVFIERPNLRGSESESLYPPELGALFKARQEKYQLSPPVPLFELVRAGQVISRHAGLRGWSEGTLPEVRQLQGKQAQSSPSR